MMKKGAGPEEMKNFRKEKMKAICEEYEQKTKDMKDKIKQEANIVDQTQDPAAGTENNDCVDKNTK